MKKISLYIHIPFCDSKCSYCDFTSFVNKDNLVDPYIKSLKKEILLYKEKLKDYNIKTIFFGGGTPTSIDGRYIYEILELIHKNFDTSELKEVTSESNPGSISKEKIGIYKAAQVNRISMGAQTFNNDLLKYIGRIHREKDIYKSVDIIKNAGINNISLDLMFGLPEQTYDMAIEAIEKAIDLDIKHISNYGLILEGMTPMHKAYLNGEIDLMDVDLDRKVYHKTRDILKSAGFNHYEISNYGKPGYESIHNLVYWNIEPYLGLGLSSHSNLEGERFSNTLDINKYIDNLSKNQLAIVNRENIDKNEEIVEYCIMGFRKIQGINKKEFNNRFQRDFEDIYEYEIGKNIKNGLLTWEKDYLRLTEKGLDFSNQVELDFFK